MASSAVDTLRKFSKESPSLDELPSLLTEILYMSDRATIVIIASQMEDSLEHLLKSKMRPLSRQLEQELFRGDGALASFSKKTKMAFALNLIDETTRNRIDDLREMRNACAHTRRFIGLDVPELANVCKRFLQHSHLPPMTETPEQLRASLVAECFYMISLITDGRDKVDALIKKAIELSEAKAAARTAGDQA